MMKRVTGYLACCILIILQPAFAAESMRIYDVSERDVKKLESVAPQLAADRIVLIGENHDQPSHHEAQLKIIKTVVGRDRQVAVGLEMFRKDSQAVLDDWVAGKISERDFRKAFSDNWGFAWDLYRDIFLFARDKQLPLVGLNVPRAVTRQVAREGFKSLSPQQKGNLPFVECVVDPEYMEFVKSAHGAHPHGGMNFNYFCEAQLVWDKAMAIHTLEFLDSHPGHMMIILTGTGHAWKKAIPEQIRQRSPLDCSVILPEVPGAIEKGRITSDDADYLILGLSR